jgi:DNA-binding transcriptional MerR regulator
MAPNGPSEIIASFTEEQVCKLTGISLRQLRYWASDGFYVPSLNTDDTGIEGLRLYSFRDLVCLKVINALRNDAKIQLKELRATKDRLAHLGEDMWAKTTLYIHGKRGQLYT